MQWGEERVEWVDLEWITTVKQFREEMKLLKKKLQVEKKRRRAQKSELHSPNKRNSAVHKAFRTIPEGDRVRDRGKLPSDNRTKQNHS